MHVALLIILIVIAILIYIILAGTTAKLLDVWDSDTEVLIFCVWWIVLPIYGLCKLYELQRYVKVNNMTSTTPHARWIATDELPISEYTEDYPTEKKSICWDDILNDKVK